MPRNHWPDGPGMRIHASPLDRMSFLASRRLARIDLAQITHLAPATGLGNRNRVAQLRRIDTNKNFAMMPHDSQERTYGLDICNLLDGARRHQVVYIAQCGTGLENTLRDARRLVTPLIWHHFLLLTQLVEAVVAKLY